MAAGSPPTAKQNLVIGAGIGCGGLCLMLVGAGLLPPPGGSGNLHAPLLVVACIGLVILLGGVAVFIQGLGRANGQGTLPADAPACLRVLQDLIGVAMFASFALVGSWIAVGGEPRQFSGNVALGGGGARLSIARVAFGVGALICWVVALALTVSHVRKWRGRRRI